MFFVSEERFQTMQHDFKEKYYHHFTDDEENKLIYMDIFKEYVSFGKFGFLLKEYERWGCFSVSFDTGTAISSATMKFNHLMKTIQQLFLFKA